MRAPRSIVPLVLATVALLGVLACRQKTAAPEPEEPAGERVENATVGVAIASLPAFFRVAANDDTIELVPADGTDAARLTVAVGEAAIGGVNLVAAVEDHKAEILERAGGEYKGQREIGGLDLGTTFYSRGRYTAEDGATEEETMVYMVHPRQDRTLQLIYRYPAGEDSAERIQDQLFAVLEQLEALPDAGESPEDVGG